MKNVSVFEVSRKNKLYVMFNKCNFWMKEVLLLDHIISKDGILVDSSIVEAVMEQKQLKNVTKDRIFLTNAVNYSRFIKEISAIAIPLTSLTKNGKKFTWDLEYEKSFQTFKQSLTTAPASHYYESMSLSFTLIFLTNGMVQFLCKMTKWWHRHPCS